MPNRAILFAISLIIPLLLLLGAGYLASRHGTQASGENVATNTPAIIASTTGNRVYTVEQVPLPTLESIEPNLNHTIAFDASIPANIRVLIQKKVDEIIARLKKDPTGAADWYDLAIYYHEADDFQGARAVWEFLIKVLPQDSVAYENLGKLYHFDLKDYPKAELYFKKAIAVETHTWDPYYELYQLYLYSYKQNTSAAVDILTEAAAKFPENSDPYYVLGTYYLGKGDTADARIAFTKAMDRARLNNDLEAMKRIGDELSTLPSQ